MGRCRGLTQNAKEGVPMPRPRIPRPIQIPIGPSIAYIPLTHGMFALIDREDAEIVAHSNWSAHFRKGGKYCYAITNVWDSLNSRQRTVQLHCFLMGNPVSFVDHRNGVTLDCRRANLRKASPAENARNQRLRSNNTSGYKGVQKRGSGFLVTVGNEYIGCFPCKEQAARIYDALATARFGEFARLNFPEARRA